MSKGNRTATIVVLFTIRKVVMVGAKVDVREAGVVVDCGGNATEGEHVRVWARQLAAMLVAGVDEEKRAGKKRRNVSQCTVRLLYGREYSTVRRESEIC